MLFPAILIFILSSLTVSSLMPANLPSQIAAFMIGLLFFFLVSRLGLIFHQFLAVYYYVFSLLFLLSTFLFGQITRGSVRWITLGSFSLQPSELVKPFLIIAFSFFAHRFPPKKLKNLFILFLLFLPPWFLVFQQPDLGGSLVIFFIWLAIVFTAGLSWRLAIGAGLAFLLSLPLSIGLLKDYQKDRILAFLDPYSDPLGHGYHTLQALIAVGSGGLFGRGLGRGSQVQLRFLPERQSDFILASFAEESGFLGGFILLLLYVWLFSMILRICGRQKNNFSFLLGVGCFASIFFQTTVNLAINLGLLPITGITLPLFSVGGSSLVATIFTLGLVQAVKNTSQSGSLLEIK